MEHKKRHPGRPSRRQGVYERKTIEIRRDLIEYLNSKSPQSWRETIEKALEREREQTMKRVCIYELSDGTTETFEIGRHIDDEKNERAEAERELHSKHGHVVGYHFEWQDDDSIELESPEPELESPEPEEEASLKYEDGTEYLPSSWKKREAPLPEPGSIGFVLYSPKEGE